MLREFMCASNQNGYWRKSCMGGTRAPGRRKKGHEARAKHREGTPLHQIELSTVHRTGVVGPNTQIAACGGASKTLDAVKKKKKKGRVEFFFECRTDDS